MTLVELAIVVVVLAIIASLLLPTLARQKSGRHIKCASNLKQVYYATRLWEGDHGDKMPWQVSTNQGGTKELARSTNVWVHWYALRTELETPRVLRCPQDTIVQPSSLTFQNGQFQPTSYALGFDHLPEGSNSTLTADRNIVRNGRRLAAGWNLLLKTDRVRWDSDIHKTNGNIGFTDGSVHLTSSPALQQMLQTSDIATNRLLIP